MIYTPFKDKKRSLLVFGTMRLPMSEGVIDEKQVADICKQCEEAAKKAAAK